VLRSTSASAAATAASAAATAASASLTSRSSSSSPSGGALVVGEPAPLPVVLVELVEQGRQPADAPLQLVAPFGGGAGQAVEPPGEDLAADAEGALLRARPLLEPVVDPEVEQFLEQGLAFVGLGVQQPGELALGQDHGGGEVLVGEAQEVHDRFRQPVGVTGQHLATAVGVGLLQARPRR
jgi:hypothetical protein